MCEHARAKWYTSVQRGARPCMSVRKSGGPCKSARTQHGRARTCTDISGGPCQKCPYGRRCCVCNTTTSRSRFPRTPEILYYFLLRLWNTPTTLSRHTQSLCMAFTLLVQLSLLHAPIALHRTGSTLRLRDVRRTLAV